MLHVGKKRATFYHNLVKRLINLNKHEEIELHSMGASSSQKVAQCASTLVKWGYVTLTRIKTCLTADFTLKVTVKRSDNFQKIFDDFEAIRVSKPLKKKVEASTSIVKKQASEKPKSPAGNIAVKPKSPI